LSAVVLWYLAVFVLLARVTGPLTALGCLAVMFSAAHALRLGGGRLQRALQRARSFVALRADPTLQPRLVADVDALIEEAVALEHALADVRLPTALPRS
jgi:hypothetical protein